MTNPDDARITDMQDVLLSWYRATGPAVWLGWAEDELRQARLDTGWRGNHWTDAMVIDHAIVIEDHTYALMILAMQGLYSHPRPALPWGDSAYAARRFDESGVCVWNGGPVSEYTPSSEGGRGFLAALARITTELARDLAEVLGVDHDLVCPPLGTPAMFLDMLDTTPLETGFREVLNVVALGDPLLEAGER